MFRDQLDKSEIERLTIESEKMLEAVGGLFRKNSKTKIMRRVGLLRHFLLSAKNKTELKTGRHYYYPSSKKNYSRWAIIGHTRLEGGKKKFIWACELK